MTSANLDVVAALKVLDSNGPLHAVLKGFEPRAEQQEMMRNVLDAYNGEHIALIEAGTGTGKSLAYLIPAMLWAAQNKERSVISTNTITLQEQLLNKDIPLIEKALKLNVKAVLVKGMHNYLCLRKFEETQQERLLLTPQEAEELDKIDAWRESTQDGSRSSLAFNPSGAMWEKVAAESDTCNRNACHYYQQCHFFKARRQASEAQILIVNHHLLFADLACRSSTENYKDPAILPNYQRIILDEAHNIEDIATEYFAARVSQMDIMRLMGRLTAEKGGKVHGKLPLLKEKIVSQCKNDSSAAVASIHNRLTIDLPGMRRDILLQTHEAFGAFYDFTQTVLKSPKGASEEQGPGEEKLRLLPYHHSHPYWKEILITRGKLLYETMQRYAQSILALVEDIKKLNNTSLDDQIKGIVFEINALASRLNVCGETLWQFVEAQVPKTRVRWMELQTLKTMVLTTLVDTELDISQLLADYLFSRFPTIILCSATLTTDSHFRFIRSRFGLDVKHLKGRAVKEHIYESPFNFSKQAMFAIPTDLPNPTDHDFVEKASDKILSIVQSSRGNAFVLFTSYSMLKLCYERLEKRLKEQRFHPLKQGDDDRQALLNRFKTTDRSVLFGADSFWEGVDVAGEALRCVIIVKLPFKVPSDPIIQARSEDIASRGGDPFMEYSLPQAIVKFKQGFGRLIRNRNDRGCIICLDNRLLKKRYGALFLNSLPNCQQAFVSSEVLSSCMTEFYRKTYPLTRR